MAPGDFRSCHSPHQNLSLIDLVKNELAKDLGPDKNPHLGSISSVLSCNLTPDPTLVPALASTLLFSNKLFKQFIKAYLES